MADMAEVPVQQAGAASDAQAGAKVGATISSDAGSSMGALASAGSSSRSSTRCDESSSTAAPAAIGDMMAAEPLPRAGSSTPATANNKRPKLQ